MPEKTNLLWMITRKYAGFYLFFFFIVLSTSILSYASPYITRRIIDFAIPFKDWRQIVRLMTILVFFGFVQSVLVLIRSKFSMFFNWKIIFTVKSTALERLIRTPAGYLKKKDVGYWVGRINNDTQQLAGLLADQAIHVLKSVIVIIVGCFLLFQMNIVMSGIALSYLLINLIIIYYFGHLVRLRYSTLLEYFGKLNGYMQNAIIWAPFAKLFMNYKKVLSYWEDGIVKFFRAFRPIINFGSIISFFSVFYTTSSVVLILTLGSWYVIHDKLTIGQLVAFNAYFMLVSNPAMEMISMINNMQKGIPALQRMNELINVELEEIGEHPGEVDSLCFSNLSCSYNAVKTVVELESADFRKGQIIGLVGHSGCGKSCLLMNLLGLYEPMGGSVAINDSKTLQSNETSALRHIAAYVEQEPILLNDTVYENIRFGKPDASNEEIEEVARLAGADQFIQQLPNRYETLLGAGGTGVSIGEKQRIAIARALIKNPQLLILDEPTSNVDKQTEEWILGSIRTFAKGRIVIITSHNPTFLDICDAVYKIENGKAVKTSAS